MEQAPSGQSSVSTCCWLKFRRASPQAFRKKIERLEKEVVDHKKNSRTTTSIVAPERLVKCGGNVEAAGRYVAGRKTVQVDKN